MKVLLIDDHALVRHGLRLTLEHLLPDVQVSEAADGLQGVTAARETQPDVCMLDATMPGLGGLDALPLLLEACPRTRVLMVSMHASPEFVSRALQAGAQGYLVKEAAVEEFGAALEALCDGRPYVSRRLADAMLVDLVRSDSNAREVPPESLTLRQRQVLQLVAEGRSTRVIAARLGVSVKTIESHRSELMRRLDIWDVAGLTRHAVREGMVEL
jgi:DNA-binding NarL/FixJ family response regulator